VLLSLIDVNREEIRRISQSAAVGRGCPERREFDLRIRRMHRNTRITICPRRFAPLLSVLYLACACSPERAWSPAEKVSISHFARSLEANRKAQQLEHAPNPDAPQLAVNEINKYQEIALREARMVTDAALDKANPELRQHFRADYQKGLELILKSYEVATASGTGAPSDAQLELQASGVQHLKRWIEWYEAHQSDIRIPKIFIAKRP
jgi:hypothetical protein